MTFMKAPMQRTPEAQPNKGGAPVAKGPTRSAYGPASEGAHDGQGAPEQRIPLVQRKPAISSPGDASEREADEIAEKVMRMSAPSFFGAASTTIVQRQGGEPPPHRPSPGREAGLDSGTAVREASRGGEPLPEELRAFFEPRFGHDFSQVRVQVNDQAAQAVQARAYTVGQNIVFGRGEYAPDTTEGRGLLAHELAHVVQQQAGRVGATTQGKEGGLHDEPAPEHGADVKRARAARGDAAGSQPADGPLVQRQADHGREPAQAHPDEESQLEQEEPKGDEASNLIAAIEALGAEEGGMDALLAEADKAMRDTGAPGTVIQRKTGDAPDGAQTAANDYDPAAIANMSEADCKRRLLEIVNDPRSVADYQSGRLTGDFLLRLCNKSSAFLWADELNTLCLEGASHQRAMAATAMTEGGFLTLPMLEGIKFAVAHPNDALASLGNTALAKVIEKRGLDLPAVQRTVDAALDSMTRAQLEAYLVRFPDLKPSIDARLRLYSPPSANKDAKEAEARFQVSDTAFKTFVRSLLRAKDTTQLDALLDGPQQHRMSLALFEVTETPEEYPEVVAAAHRWLRTLALSESLPSRPVAELEELAEGLGKDGVRRVDAYLKRTASERSSARYGELHAFAVRLAARFGGSVLAPPPKVEAGIEYSRGTGTESLERKIDVLVLKMREELPSLAGAHVTHLEQRKVELRKTPAAEIPNVAKRLDSSLLTLELAIKLQGMLPEEDPKSPEEMVTAVTQGRAAIERVLSRLATPGEDEALGQLQKAHTGFILAYTRQFILNAQTGKGMLPDLKQPPPYLDELLQGYARGGRIHIGDRSAKWAIFQTEVDRLQAEMNKLGELKARAEAPLVERLKFLGAEGADISAQLQRLQALTTLSNAFRIGAALMHGVLEQDDILWTDVAHVQRLISQVIDPLSAQLDAGGMPKQDTLQKAAVVVEDLFDSTEKRLKNLAEAHQRQEWFFDIAATLVGMGAMSKAMKAMKAVQWFYRGGRAALLGKQALKFAIGSLIFTTASSATRAVFKGELPTAAEFAKQAGVDLATLGILHGVSFLVGLRFGRISATLSEAEQQAALQKLGVMQTGATFATLWAWASGETIWNMKPEERTLENVLGAIAKTGARTALDLAALHFGQRLGSLPRIGDPQKVEAAKAKLNAEYEQAQRAGQQVETEINKWSKEGSDPAKLDPLLKKADRVFAQLRSIYDRMVDVGMLKAEQQKLLSDATLAERTLLQNLREAARLQLQEKSETVQSYRGEARNIDLYLKRLKQQGIITDVRPRSEGVFEVAYTDGVTRWFYPEGQQPPNADKVLYNNEVPPAEVQQFPSLSEGLRGFVASGEVRFVQGTAARGAELRFKDGRAVVVLGKEYTPAELNRAVAEAQRLWVDPKARKNVKVEVEALKEPWEQARETSENLGKLEAEQPGTSDATARESLAREIERQVPDLTLLEQVQAGKAKIVITLVVPGGGPTGVKTMNDKLIGYQLNSTLVIPARNSVLVEAFEGLPYNEKASESIRIVEQSYKSLTMTTTIGDVARLQRLMAEGMRRVDLGMFRVLKDAFKEGKRNWTAELEKNAANKDSEQYKDAKKRVENIDRVLADLERAGPEGFRFDMQFGLAEVRGGGAAMASEQTAYQAALEAKMNASKAASMARSGGTDGQAAQEAAGGDTRGRVFDEKAFLGFAASAAALRTQIIARGNILTIAGRPQRIFVEQAGQLLPNEHILRDVRKDKITKDELPSNEHAQLELIKKYMNHINAFDFFKGFTSKESVDVLPGRMKQAQALADALRENRPVDPAQVQAMLEQDVTGQIVPQMGTASEAAFYNRARTSSERILINADIIDLGLDALMTYTRQMEAVSAKNLKGEELFRASKEATDALIEFKRRASDEVQKIHEQFRQRAIADLEKKPNRTPEEDAVLKQLRQETNALMLLGGDEITLSLHPALQSYIPELVQAVARACRGRVAVTQARTAPEKAGDEAARVEAHQKAMKAADPAANVLKGFEVELRKLNQMVGQVEDVARRRSAQEMVDTLALDQFFADVDPKTGEVKLRRLGSGVEVLESDLKAQIQETKKQIHDLYGAPLPALAPPSHGHKAKDDEDVPRIKPVPRPRLPTSTGSVDFAAEALERAAPGLSHDTRAKALANLRRLPTDHANRVIVALPEGQSTELATWLARPGVGEMLGAMSPEFAAELLLTDRAFLVGLSPRPLLFWYQSGFQKAAGGGKVSDFLRFLRDLEKYSGNLEVSSLEQAKQRVESFSRTGPAFPYAPRQSLQPTISSPDAPRSPYRISGEYLIQKGISQGPFFSVDLDGGLWVLQQSDAQVTRGWFFDGAGEAPKKDVDIRGSLQKLREAIASAQGKPRSEAQALLNPLEPLFNELLFLRRVRDVDLKEVYKVLEQFEALRR
ncbi:DUF4157 domain-containing protein [Vitiosangium sp. GDMCC 1.1324]|uniref:eCIS core domain-containing protein n=1 Tax=Vitiosangium sp. (strain GDMCC 1.1324) TaxID=2138576 RepID=UPI000D35531B|nr:DUF4157 domain-containing protein [Vitiosangium sp. GDMCC 1.1324]PTL78082.1 hypothetical protein DAT35_41445 [Vitiosangium sp. GDMCC 1.1324]